MADLISVIVPVYNIAADLPRCLDSILAQTCPQLEIIAVDDGSTDGSGGILDSYAEQHPHIRVIHQENGGVTSARLRGIREATGNWIGFVDGDDFIEPDMYARLLNNALTHQVPISHCGYRMVFPDGRVHYFHNSGLAVKHHRDTALRELLSGEMIEPGLWNKLFRRSLFDSLTMDADIRINEDLLMNFYLFAKADSAYFEDWCPYHYIVRSTSASRAGLNPHKIYDPIRVKERILQAAPESIREDARRAYMNTCVNTYHTLLFAGAEYRADLENVRALLGREKAAFPLMGRKRAWMARLIAGAPIIYKPIYGLYRRLFQKRIYS